MNVKELKEALAAYPDDMEVKVEHTKSCMGTYDVSYVDERDVKDLEDYCRARDLGVDWQGTEDKVCLIGFR